MAFRISTEKSGVIQMVCLYLYLYLLSVTWYYFSLQLFWLLLIFFLSSLHFVVRLLCIARNFFLVPALWCSAWVFFSLIDILPFSLEKNSIILLKIFSVTVKTCTGPYLFYMGVPALWVKVDTRFYPKTKSFLQLKDIQTGKISANKQTTLKAGPTPGSRWPIWNMVSLVHNMIVYLSDPKTLPENFYSW